MLTASKTAKIGAVILIIVTLAAAGIVYYAATRPSSSDGSPTPAPTSSVTPEQTPSPTDLPTPSATSVPTFPTQTPTSTAPSTPTGSSSSSPTPSPSESPTQEKVRDSAMTFIRTNHPETAQFMMNLSWAGGRATPPNIVGAETYMYFSQGWNVTITYPVVPDPIYKITANYSATGIGIPYRVIWVGTWQNEIINETSYVFAQ